MVSDEEFRALQTRVEQLERLVPAIDRDVAAIQAQRRADLELLMALRGTQLEHVRSVARWLGDPFGAVVMPGSVDAAGPPPARRSTVQSPMARRATSRSADAVRDRAVS